GRRVGARASQLHGAAAQPPAGGDWNRGHDHVESDGFRRPPLLRGLAALGNRARTGRLRAELDVSRRDAPLPGVPARRSLAMLHARRRPCRPRSCVGGEILHGIERACVRTMTNAFDLSDRTIIVTGGAGLLGREYARALAGANASVVLADIN